MTRCGTSIDCSTMNITDLTLVNPTHSPLSHRWIHGLQLIYVPCLTLLGIGGNILCAIVFTTKSLR
jgi:hypothetical protein